MAEVNGKLTICDRCGETNFRKCIGEGERDGGFTQWNKFEPSPEGWTSREVPSRYGRRRGEYMMLCPRCNQVWIDALTANGFIGKTFEEEDEADAT
jgi:hypothetical protein